jgi:hypothetical protein
MRIKFSTLRLLEQTRRYLVALTAAFCLICFALAQGASQLNTPKRITGLQISETAEGSRMTVIADSALDDYEAFRRGDRFYVKIPSAVFSALQPSLHGDGFEDVHVQKVGDSIVISFKLQPGASARVAEGSNRLEVIFFAPNRMASNGNASAVRSRVTRSSTGTRNLGAQRTPKREADVVGPMPSDSPTGYSRYSALESRPEGTSSGTASRIRPANRRESSQTAVLSSDPANPNSAPNQAATPHPAPSQYSSTYPPASTTVTPAPTQTSMPSTDTGSGWLDLRSRGQAALQWVSTNRMAAVGSGLGVLAMLWVVAIVLYRRRRTIRNATSKTPRVQPKYSPDVQLEDMLAARVSAASLKVAPGPYVDEEAYENWDESGAGREDFLPESLTQRASDLRYEPAAAVPKHFEAFTDEPWEIASGSNPRAHQSRVQQEREVFEL